MKSLKDSKKKQVSFLQTSLMFGFFLGFAMIVASCAVQYGSKNYREMLEYAENFSPENVDSSFRSLHKLYPSLSIPSLKKAIEFERETLKNVFPVKYVFEGEAKSIAKLFEDYNWTGIVIAHNKKIIHEAYDRGNTAQDYHNEMSVTKSLTSILVGVAHDEGDISDLNALVTNFVPELKATGYENVTVQQVLDMTSGIRFSEDDFSQTSENFRTLLASINGSQDEVAKSIVNMRQPGSFNQYASIETHVLAWVLRKATGSSYEDYFDKKLWSKIGAEGDAKLLIDGVGQPVAFGGASLKLRDLARIGQMLVSNGVAMTGERVLSQSWVEKMTVLDTLQSQTNANSSLSDSPSIGYKNQWWIPKNRSGGEYTAIGVYGQFLYINPKHNIVIAMNAAYPDYAEDGEVKELEMIAAFQAIATHIGSIK